MIKPNLFIVGAPKAGTTFLYTTLIDHPEVFFPKTKEPNYFAHEELAANSYYKDYRITNQSKYLNFFKSSQGEKHIVDGSVSYFAFPTVAKKIYDFNNNAKIVITVRNPIKRAFSHYQMDKRMGHASSAFGDYINKPKTDPHYIQYIQNSLYYENLASYLSTFSNENVHVMVLEQMDNEIESLLIFLDIDPLEEDIDTDKRVNMNKAPKNALARFFQKNRRIATVIKFIIPYKLIKKMNRFLYKEAEKEVLDSKTEKELFKIFKEDIQNLSTYLNRDLMDIWNLKHLENE
jgi:hypothetical protein